MLTAFADAVVKGSESEVPEAREAVADAMGPEAMVDTAAIIGNFERMNRIADAAGLELDAPVRFLSGDVRDGLGLNEFGTAANTKPTGPLVRVLSKWLLPVALKFYKPPMSGR